jgi:hypothetical protein
MGMVDGTPHPAHTVSVSWPFEVDGRWITVQALDDEFKLLRFRNYGDARCERWVIEAAVSIGVGCINARFYEIEVVRSLATDLDGEFHNYHENWASGGMGRS